ncbi:MAG: hypothetical protein PHV30_10535 [Candidatus Margulisbacteria bacterium]|nr:hypothetical protein [Candidatus Margulisiibacteriota bacterium]
MYSKIIAGVSSGVSNNYVSGMLDKYYGLVESITNMETYNNSLYSKNSSFVNAKIYVGSYSVSKEEQSTLNWLSGEIYKVEASLKEAKKELQSLEPLINKLTVKEKHQYLLDQVNLINSGLKKEGYKHTKVEVKFTANKNIKISYFSMYNTVQQKAYKSVDDIIPELRIIQNLIKYADSNRDPRYGKSNLEMATDKLYSLSHSEEEVDEDAIPAGYTSRYQYYYQQSLDKQMGIGEPFGRSMFDIPSLEEQNIAEAESKNRISRENGEPEMWEVVNGEIREIDMAH